MGNGAIGTQRCGSRSVVTSPFVGIEVPVNDIISYLSDVFQEKAKEVALVGVCVSTGQNSHIISYLSVSPRKWHW